MLTAAQQYAIDQFAEGLLALGDEALIDTYHQNAVFARWGGSHDN
jgi:hypothetical protein